MIQDGLKQCTIPGSYFYTGTASNNHIQKLLQIIYIGMEMEWKDTAVLTDYMQVSYICIYRKLCNHLLLRVHDSQAL